MAKAFVKDTGACIRAGYPIVTIVTPVLERRLQCNQRTPGIGLVRFLGLSDEQPSPRLQWIGAATGSVRPARDAQETQDLHC